jgi:hypothetical protein
MARRYPPIGADVREISAAYFVEFWADLVDPSNWGAAPFSSSKVGKCLIR